MAINNISITQEVHQKPSVDATQHIIESEQKRAKDQDIQRMLPETIISFIDGLTDDINKNATEIQCIAMGGHALAERSEESICEGMFGAIVSMSESAKNYLLLKDAISELCYRATSSMPTGPIKKPVAAKIDALQGANDAVWVAQVGMSCIENNISPILVAIEALTHVQGMDGKDFAKRMAAIQSLAQVGVRTAEEMTNTMDCERETMQGKLSKLEAAPECSMALHH